MEMKSYGLRSAWVNWSSKSGDFAQLGEPTFSDNCYEGVRSHETSRSLGMLFGQGFDNTLLINYDVSK